MRGTFHRRSAAASVVLILASACGDVGGPSEQAATVTLAASSTEVTVGGTLQLAATVLNATGAVMGGQQVQWTSLDPLIASVTPAGLVSGLTAGSATIRATTGAATGNIVLSVRPAACAPASVTGALPAAGAVNGVLASTDCLLYGSHADGWTFAVTTPAPVRIDLASSQFQGVLVVTDMAMNPIAITPSFLGQLPLGNYIVWATSYEAGATGAYSLTVSPVTLCSPATTAGTLALGQTVTGTLTPGSCVLPHGNVGAGWRFTVTAETSVRVEMQASGFMPMLVATDLNLNPLAFGLPSGPGGTVEFLHRFLPGEYVIWGTSVDGGTGSFSISMSEARLAACTPAAGTVTPGQTVTGTLHGGSCRLSDGRWAAPWQLTLSAAAALRIDMTSSQFDTYLIVTDADGRIVALDDDGGIGTNSRLTQHFAAGSYTVWATTFMAGESGAYQLSVQPAAGGGTAGSTAGGAVGAFPLKLGWPQRPDGEAGGGEGRR